MIQGGSIHEIINLRPQAMPSSPENEISEVCRKVM